MIFAEAPQVIQVEWQALAAFGVTVGGALVASAKILASQWQRNSDAQDKRHAENRQDALAARGDSKEARDENRALSGAILTIQGKTVETLGGVQEALAGVQSEIQRVVTRLDRFEGVSHTGSKGHKPL